MRLFLSNILSLLFASGGLAGCKNKPGSAGWPAPNQWDSLNQTVEGRLIHTIPPGGVCHAGQPNYNPSSCSATTASWSTEDFHAQNPFSFDYNDDTCYPDARAPCSAAGYPVYVIDARRPTDVQAGVKFAQSHNIRLVVKGTGHDYNFRSNAPNSLRIWTHNMQGMNFTSSFTPKGGQTSFAAATLQAGTQWGDAYKAAAANNVQVVGGSDPTVGIGGFLLGGGHGPLTPQYGLGADQVLEMQVVTFDGQIQTCNAYQNKDLFWALRGGGPSFAVIISVTVKTYPLQPVTTWGFLINSTNNDALWDATTYFHSQLAQLNEAGLTCYYFVRTSSGPRINGTLYGLFISYGETNVTQLVQPLVKGMNAGPWFNKTSGFGGITTQYPNLYAFTMNGQHTEQVGNDGRLGSRLLDEQSLTSDPKKLRAALEASTPPGQLLMGHLTAGKGVREAKVEGGGNAVLPAWRYSYVHMVGAATWTLANSTAVKDAATTALRDQRVAALRNLAPETGSYMSEGDPTEPNWQQTFWGSNYATLLTLKKKYDPNGLMYCQPCVGSELYEEKDGVVCSLGS